MSQSSPDLPVSDTKPEPPRKGYGSLTAMQYLISAIATVGFGGVGAWLGSAIGAWGDTHASTVAPQVTRKLARPIMQFMIGGAFATLALYSSLKSFVRENEPAAATPESAAAENANVYLLPKHVSNPDAPQAMAEHINLEGKVARPEIAPEEKQLGAR